MASSTAWTLAGTPDPGWKLTVAGDDVPPAADPSLATLSEADLVAACLAGQSGAFDLIVERHRRTLYQLCYRFVGNHEDASDLTQDVLLRAYRGLRNFKGNSSLARGYRIGVNVCLNRVALKTPQSEPIDARQFIDNAASRLANACCAASGPSGSRRDHAAAAQTARRADPADVSRHVAPGDRGRARQHGRRGQDQRAHAAERNGCWAKEPTGMRHLSPDLLIDLAEGTRRVVGRASRRVRRVPPRGLREMMAVAVGAAIPEPSPLFWDHLSARPDGGGRGRRTPGVVDACAQRARVGGKPPV
jgi:DNA-directed RNA polymerase specialized sigma24 family protein